MLTSDKASTGGDIASETGSDTKRLCRNPQALSSSSSRGRSEEAASLPQPAEELSKLEVGPSVAGTDTETMDSEDDFMTDASSQEDFLDMQGSDDESLGEGGTPSLEDPA